MSLKQCLLTLAIILGYLGLSAQVLTGSLSKNSMTSCDSAVATISGYFCCGNSSLTGNSHSINGSTITINVTSTCPSICLPSLVVWNTTYVLSNLPAGTYTVKYAYNGSPSGTVTSSLTIQNSSQATAGNDTTVCDASTLTLNGNQPPTNVTGTWSVISGSVSFNNSALYNTSITNIGYGANVLEWTINDPACATSDKVTISNDESPSPANTETNRFSCYDTTTIVANAITGGTGKWNVITPGVLVPNKNLPSTKALYLNIGQNLFEWTVDGKSCGINRDTLTISYDVYVDTPNISAAGNLLTSSPAPAYQWYLNGSPISSATAQTHHATVNGIYKVLAGFQGCDNGLFSNEIEILFAGIGESSMSEIQISPNPSTGVISITGMLDEISIELTDFSGRILKTWKNQRSYSNTIDLDQNAGIYLLQLYDGQSRRIFKVVIE